MPISEFYKSTDINLQKHSILRSFRNSISYRNVNNEVYEKYKNSSEFLSSFIVNNQSPQPEWNGTDIPNEPVAKQPVRKRNDDFFGLNW